MTSHALCRVRIPGSRVLHLRTIFFLPNSLDVDLCKEPIGPTAVESTFVETLDRFVNRKVIGHCLANDVNVARRTERKSTRHFLVTSAEIGRKQDCPGVRVEL